MLGDYIAISVFIWLVAIILTRQFNRVGYAYTLFDALSFGFAGWCLFSIAAFGTYSIITFIL